jgi:hypothetical protein
MTRVRKGRANAKSNPSRNYQVADTAPYTDTAPSRDEVPKLAICFSEDTKMVLQRILSNAIACIAEEFLHDATGLGVLAAHLEAIAEAAHDCIDRSPFHEGLAGDTVDEFLCKQLQVSPLSWADLWDDLPEHLRPR